MSDVITQDFIFGTLATDDLRLEAIRRELRGLSHAHHVFPTDPEPGQAIRINVSAGTDVAANRVVIYYTLDGSIPDEHAEQMECEAGASVWDTLLWGYRRHWHARFPSQPEGTTVRYRIAATTESGETVWADPDPETNQPATFAFTVDRETLPDWFRDAVIYHIFLDRYSPGAGNEWNAAERLNEIWGGTIRGVTEQLPYLADLGVSCLWLSPIFPSPTHHGYDATDYWTVEPRLGTLDELRDLFAAAHERGIRVILDFTANHLSNEHPTFTRALADPDVPEREWFTFIDDGSYRTFFGVETMPKIDTNHPGARAHLIEAATYWLEQGADGFRLDYANGPSHDFWTAFRAATRAVKRDSALVGEIVETAELQRSYQGRLDGTLDFLLLQQLRAFFAFDLISAQTFGAFLSRHLDYFPEGFVLPSFLDNHDMNRFLWIAGGDQRRLKLAALCQFTLPHPPILYYGAEVGLSQRHDLTYPDGSRRMEESRTLMPWGADQDAHLLAYFQALIALRRRHQALWRGTRTIVEASDDLLVLDLTEETVRARIALNRSSQPASVEHPADLSLALSTEPPLALDGTRTSLAPMSGAIWTSS